jgi:hypothetical protein
VATQLLQVLEFVNCQLFNQLLLRPECCSVSNARYALRGLKQLDTWITAEQSAASHRDVTHGGPTGRHTPHSVTGVGSIHSGSFNSQAPSPQAPTAAAAAAAAGGGEGAAASRLGSSDASGIAAAAAAPIAAAAAVAGGGGEGSVVASRLGSSDASSMSAAVAAEGSSGATAEHKPAAAAAVGDDEDGGWEQVPAHTGEFDTWQPPQQQQQQQHWWLPNKQQQQQPAGGAAEQPELGPEAWNALAHVRQVR